MDDVYYSHDIFGLEKVGEAYEADLSYEFNLFCVWKDASGQLYWAHDSGCSCPSPFEDYTSVAMLDKGTVTQAHAALDAWHPKGNDETAASVTDLHAKLAAL